MQSKVISDLIFAFFGVCYPYSNMLCVGLRRLVRDVVICVRDSGGAGCVRECVHVLIFY